jgi:hypothetical protein
MKPLYPTIDIRQRLQGDNREWKDIPPTTIRVRDNSPEELADLHADVHNVVEVRWNWGGVKAGLGQGHYVLGRAHRWHSSNVVNTVESE